MIRIAVRAWLALYPFRSLLRWAAMFVVMAVSGLSAMLMMGDRLRPQSAPPTTTSAAAAQPTTTESRPDSVDLDAVAEPVPPSEASTTSVAPTAVGPAGPNRPESIPDESEISPTAAVIYPTTPYPVPTLSDIRQATLPEVRTSDPPPAIARLRGDIQEVPPR